MGDKKGFIVFVLVCIGIFIFLYYRDHYERTDDQLRLVQELKNIAASDLKSVVIEPYQLSPKKFVQVFTDSDKLKNVCVFLRNVQTIPPVGSHVQRLYECTITFHLEKRDWKYLVEVFNDKPTDAYMADNFYTSNNDGTYSASAMRPVYLAGFGSWLLRNGPVEGKLKQE